MRNSSSGMVMAEVKNERRLEELKAYAEHRELLLQILHYVPTDGTSEAGTTILNKVYISGIGNLTPTKETCPFYNYLSHHIYLILECKLI